MIFYSDVVRDLVQDSYKNLTNMVVYKGRQLSAQEYVEGINTGTHNWNGTYLLQAYNNVDLTVNKVGSTYKIEKNSAVGTTYGNYIKQSGTAEWAVLFDNSMIKTSASDTNKLLEFTVTNELNFLRTMTEEDLFMIVPVSNTAGDGVLKFNTIEFDGVANQAIKKFTLNFS
jgi:hypothetical protein